MLRASIDHAEDDMQARALREQQVEARRVVEALDSALKADGSLLTDDERRSIDAARGRLVAVGEGDDGEAIKRAIGELEKACEDFVARRMNTSIRKAMKGHAIDEYAIDDE